MHSLTTDRLTLRPFTPDDADFVLDTYSRWEVQRYIGRVPRVLADREEALGLITRWRAIGEHPVHGVWLAVDTASGERLGTLLLKDIPASGTDRAPSGDTEIGWHLHPDAWGRGIATEGARAVLARAFAGGLDRVVAVTHPDNLASQRVAERIGLRSLGLSSAYYDTECALFAADRAESAAASGAPA
ncbi:GNAT family N-acetyltransferase [Galbitalea sp. SE-J8]|uniref:GNAT family N-acetyltransferase n=1 Tax=Galbitalea sp. SE-J8 TaxID=3054952 RepID=UPI00259D0F93|nr:GNAT family N-acetyltransferase [Galbitalea sp. SE-J8]MDM4761420.1 GNAT family N-acetyltransferase [Galbitalea sp. SE-J8]